MISLGTLGSTTKIETATWAAQTMSNPAAMILCDTIGRRILVYIHSRKRIPATVGIRSRRRG